MPEAFHLFLLFMDFLVLKSISAAVHGKSSWTEQGGPMAKLWSHLLKTSMMHTVLEHRDVHVHLSLPSCILTRKMYYARVIKHVYTGKKAILKGWKSGLFVNLIQFPYSWIWIRIPNRDPDPAPGELNQYGSMRMWIRIRNTGLYEFLVHTAMSVYPIPDRCSKVNSEHMNLFSHRDNFWNERFLVERFMLYLRYFT